ncbi:conserved hypothetical protein, partial [Perkinsus marinus ATCC 50983]
MVFDKTGTITKDGMELSGVIPVRRGSFDNRVDFGNHSASRLPTNVIHGLAACHTVRRLRDNRLVGNQVEIAMLEKCGWSLSVGGDNTFVTSPDGSSVLEVLRLLPFDHVRMTSGCVVRERDTGRVQVLVKGSYERMGELCHVVPADYSELTDTFAASNMYVLALGVREIGADMVEEVLTMSRTEIENSLTLLALLLFKNEVKPDSALAISMLREGDIRSVVCTGDNPLTAIGISKEVGIIDDTKPVLLAHIVTNDKGGSSLVWSDPESGDEMTPVKGVHQLVVTRGAWRYLYYEQPDELEEYWYDILVYARMKPSDKVSVVKWYQSHKLVVGMCGDGGNDCGALRAAHAAMALSQAEASM